MTSEERMAKLERQVRRMKWAVLLLGLALVVGIGWRSRVLSPGLVHGQNPRIVEAEEFRVVDENGKSRASLRVDKDESLLGFYDENGIPRAELRVFKDGSGLTLMDENGEFRAVLGSTSLEVVRTGTVEKLAPSSLVLFDKDGKVLFKAP